MRPMAFAGDHEVIVAVEPQLDGIHRQHAVDGEMPADIAQKIDVVEAVEPIGVVGNQRPAVAKV